MLTAFRVVAPAALILALLAEAWGQAPQSKPKPKSVPGTGQPALRPYSVPGTGQPAFTQPYYGSYTYRYPYSYPYQSYYSGPYRSVPGTGIPAYPQPYYPPVTSWRLGIMGVDWPGVGVRITSMQPNSPAERMGIEVTDVIVQINGRPIRSMYDLRNALAYSNGYARVLVLDNRTNSYMWHNGTLFEEPVAAPGAIVPGAAVPDATSPAPDTTPPMTPGVPMPETPATATPGSGSGN